jgi:hypothetical protein
MFMLTYLQIARSQMELSTVRACLSALEQQVDAERRSFHTLLEEMDEVS